MAYSILFYTHSCRWTYSNDFGFANNPFISSINPTSLSTGMSYEQTIADIADGQQPPTTPDVSLMNSAYQPIQSCHETLAVDSSLVQASTFNYNEGLMSTNMTQAAPVTSNVEGNIEQQALNLGTRSQGGFLTPPLSPTYVRTHQESGPTISSSFDIEYIKAALLHNSAIQTNSSQTISPQTPSHSHPIDCGSLRLALSPSEQTTESQTGPGPSTNTQLPSPPLSPSFPEVTTPSWESSDDDDPSGSEFAGDFADTDNDSDYAPVKRANRSKAPRNGKKGKSPILASTRRSPARSAPVRVKKPTRVLKCEICGHMNVLFFCR